MLRQCAASLSQTTNTAAAYVTCVINLWQTSYFKGSTTLTDERFRRSITFDSWISSAFRDDHHAAPHWKEERFRHSVTFDSFHFQRRSLQGISWCTHRIITRLSYTLSKQCLQIGFLWSQLFHAIKKKNSSCSYKQILHCAAYKSNLFPTTPQNDWANMEIFQGNLWTNKAWRTWI